MNKISKTTRECIVEIVNAFMGNPTCNGQPNFEPSVVTAHNDAINLMISRCIVYYEEYRIIPDSRVLLSIYQRCEREAFDKTL